MIKILPLLLLLFAGCATKYQKPKTALQTHNLIYKAVQNDNLDKADELFLTLEADYPASFYIKDDLLILYKAHKDYGEFELAKFYLNEYEKRFANQKEIEWCEYKKIYLDFLSYQNAYTNQGKILDLLNEAKAYKLNYPNSTYIYEVNTIYIKTLLTNLYLSDKIKHLYKKLGKIKAAKEINATIPKSTPPQVPWYKKLFYW
ncbi:MAG: outer membrane protein assembly factor BamD [Epsilonproteobacteria bacterium]|nr:outer membrane protein assembly factor BamD [Campylobacterota bacterium]